MVSLPSQLARRSRRGMALLLALFVIFLVSSLVLNVLDTETLQYSAARNAVDYEKALYLANAGIQHACVAMELDSSWRGTVTDGSYPASGSYSATAANGVGVDVVITSYGVAGSVTRTVQASIDL